MREGEGGVIRSELTADPAASNTAAHENRARLDCSPSPLPPAATSPQPKSPAADAKSYAYKIELSFTPRALEKLQELGEKVTVSNFYHAMAAPGAAARAETMGQVGFGDNAMQVEPANQIVRVSVSPFDPAKLKDIEGEPRLLINVFTARKAAPDNLLVCGIYDDDLAKAEAAPIPIACDLIEPEILVEPEAPAPLGYP